MELSLAEIRRATGGEILAGTDRVCRRICIDSRRVAPGDLFVAIPGERFDGHCFIPAAVAAGAVAVLASRPVEAAPGTGVILVPDTITALGALARCHRRRFRLPVVAVTGSIGKTSTKEMIASIGAVRHRVAKTPGNQNNEIGLPLTLLALEPADELLVVEMGMRGRGQIAALASIAEPTIGVVTNIGHTHLELLGTQAAIADAKGELLEALPADGTAVIPADDAFYRALSAKTKARLSSFGLSGEAGVRAERLALHAEGSTFDVTTPRRSKYEVRLTVPGRHHVLNALAAAAVAEALGYSPEEVKTGLESYAPVGGRGSAFRTAAGWTVIDDTYNASPDSVLAALEVLKARPAAGRKIAVLGDMLELGPAALEGHQRVGRAAAHAGLSLLLATGDLAREFISGAVAAGFPATMARFYPDKNTLLADLGSLLREGDLVLVKGSRGMHLEEVVAGISGWAR
ncbi:MAG: UDP-N-acetylmuramoyl-tripeptide--D-alanyl-D-alanine ligase [Bacteroidota bacterium]